MYEILMTAAEILITNMTFLHPSSVEVQLHFDSNDIKILQMNEGSGN